MKNVQTPIPLSEREPDKWREIPLASGQVALVDDSDYKSVSMFKWTTSTKGYAMRRRRKTEPSEWPLNIKMHQQIMGFGHRFIDHKNRDRLDNRRSNLRLCDAGQSQANKIQGGYRGGIKTSKFKGVSWEWYPARITTKEGFWRATVCKDRKKHSKTFQDEEAAARWYDETAKRIWGEFALTNFQT